MTVGHPASRPRPATALVDADAERGRARATSSCIAAALGGTAAGAGRRVPDHRPGASSCSCTACAAGRWSRCCPRPTAARSTTSCAGRRAAGRRHAIAVAAWCAAAVLAKFVAAAPLLVVLVAGAGVVSVLARAGDRRRGGRGRWPRRFSSRLAVPWFAAPDRRCTGRGSGTHVRRARGHARRRLRRPHPPAAVVVLPAPSSPRPLPDDVAVRRGRRRCSLAWRARTGRSRRRVLVALWFVVPIVLFSLAASKLVHYVYPALPALAVIGGQAFGAAGGAGRGRERAGADAPAGAMAGAVAVAAVLALGRGRVARPRGHRRRARERAHRGPGAPAGGGRGRGLVAPRPAARGGGRARRRPRRLRGRPRVRPRAGARRACAAVRSAPSSSACPRTPEATQRRIRVVVGRPLRRDERYYFGRVGWREPRARRGAPDAPRARPRARRARRPRLRALPGPGPAHGGLAAGDAGLDAVRCLSRPRPGRPAARPFPARAPPATERSHRIDGEHLQWRSA